MNATSTKKMISLLMATVLISSSVTASRSAFAEALPDEFDYAQYLERYQLAKQNSDQARAQAEAMNQNVAQLQSTLDEAHISLRESVAEIERLTRGLDQSNRESSALRAQNEATQVELNRHQSDLIGQRILLDRERAQLGAIREQLARESRELEGAEQNLRRIAGQHLERRRARDEAVKDRDQAHARLEEARRNLASSESELSTIDTVIAEISRRVIHAQDEVAQLQANIRTSDANLSRVNEQIASAQSTIAPKQVKVRDARNAENAAEKRKGEVARSVLAAERELSQIRSEVANGEAKVQEARAKVKTLKTEMSGVEGEIQKLKSEHADAQNELGKLDQEANELKQTEIKFEREFAKANDSIKEKEREIAKLRAVNPNDPKLKVLEDELTRLQKRAGEIEARLKEVNTAQANLVRRRSAIDRKIDSIARQIAVKQSRMSALPGEIQQAESELSTAQARLSEANRKVSSAEQALARAQAAVGPADRELATAREQLAVAERELAQAEAAIQPLVTQRQQLQNQLASLNQSLGQKQTALNSLRTDLQAKTERKTRLVQLVNQLRPQLDQLGRAFAEADRSVRQHQAEVDAAERQVAVAQNHRDSQLIVVRRIEAQARDAERDFQQIAGTIHELERLITEKQHYYATNRARIDELHRYIREASQSLAEYQTYRDQLQAQIRETSRQLTRAQSELARLEQTATQLESMTAREYEAYAARLARYEAEVEHAQQDGRTQAAPRAESDGLLAGERQGASDGSTKGRSEGKTQGLIAGFNQGRQVGDGKGYSEGLSLGQQSEADYASGLQRGIVLGREDAFSEAKRVDFPRGQSSRKAEILADDPDQVIVIDGEKKSSILGARLLQGLKISAFEFAAPASEGGEFVGPQSLGMVVAPASECAQEIDEFRAACEAAFASEYDRVYAATFESAYRRLYTSKYNEAYSTAFAQNQTVRYQEGFDRGFGEGRTRGLTDGQKQAQSRGLADGRKQGYEQTIGDARTVEFANGRTAMEQFFNTNAVVQARGITLTRVGVDGSEGGEIGAGDFLKLGLDLVNFGSIANKTGEIQVSLEPLTANISVENRVASQLVVPGQTIAQVKRLLTARILPGAEAGTSVGAEEKLKVKVTYPDGTSTEKVIKVAVVPRLQVEIKELRYVTKPKLNVVQTMSALVANIGKMKPNAKLTLKLSTTAPSTALTIKKSEVKIVKLPPKSSYLIPGLSYTVKDAAALAQGIPLRVTVLHGTQVVAVKDVVLQK